jgi:hypothetical protein
LRPAPEHLASANVLEFTADIAPDIGWRSGLNPIGPRSPAEARAFWLTHNSATSFSTEPQGRALMFKLLRVERLLLVQPEDDMDTPPSL